jgi:hypothetical protein
MLQPIHHCIIINKMINTAQIYENQFEDETN